jgi:Holliday junction resolvase YEN1
LLQRDGLVDAVLSEDVDTLMFGSGITFRNWTPEASKNGTPTHVNVYDAHVTKTGSGLDREGMILVALMSGGDYIPEGIPGCGPKTACEAARAGFGADLCKISRKDKTSLKIWRERLAYELRSNESKFFKRKHAALEIPEDFPNSEVLGYYTHPCISPPDKVIRLRDSLKWDDELNYAELRTFTGDAFDWTKLGGAKKFIRNLAPAMLVRELRMQGQRKDTSDSDELDYVKQREDKLINAIHGKRNHASTDLVTELRVSFTPHTLVPIDLDAEEPDDEVPVDSGDEGQDDGNGEAGEAPASPSKKRAPSTYDPTIMEKLWVFETYVKVGVPLKMQDWEESLRDVRKYVALKHPSKEAAAKIGKSRRGTTKTTKSAMPQGALDRFTRVSKPGKLVPGAPDKIQPSNKASEPPNSTEFQLAPPPSSQPSTFRVPPPVSSMIPVATSADFINLLSSSPATQISNRSVLIPGLSQSLEFELPSTITKRRRSPLRRIQTDTAILDLTEPPYLRPTTPPGLGQLNIPDSPSSLPSPSLLLPTKKARRAIPTEVQSKISRTAAKAQKGASKEGSSPARQKDITQFFLQSKQHQCTEPLQGKQATSLVSRKSDSRGVEELDLTDSPAQPRFSFQKHEQPSRKESTAKASRPRLLEMDPNLVESQVQERRSKELPKAPLKASRVEHMPTPFQEPEALDLTSEDLPTVVTSISQVPSRLQSSSTRSVEPRQPANHCSPPVHASTSLSFPPPPASRTNRQRKTAKEVIRIRESMDGTFAIEQIDLSGDGDAGMARVHAAAISSRKLFRMSEVSILDLTGD